MKILLATPHPGGLVLELQTALARMKMKSPHAVFAGEQEIHCFPCNQTVQTVYTSNESPFDPFHIAILDRRIDLDVLRSLLCAIQKQIPRVRIIEYKLKEPGWQLGVERMVAGTKSWDEVFCVLPF